MNEINLPVNDKELVVAACKGSELAFRKLYDRYWHDLYKIACRRLPSEEDVKDVLQDTFVSLWKNMDHIAVDENIGGYLYTSLRNKIFNHYDKKQVRLKVLMNQPFQPVESEDNIYHALNTKEIKKVIREIVAGMPPKMQQIYLLSKEEQLTNAAIAGMLMLAPQTVKNQVHQAMSRLRTELQKVNPLLFFLLL